MDENYTERYPNYCTICGNTSFTRNPILWDSLVEEWGLNSYERNYIDDQQGLRCESCKTNLRSMTLAFALLNELGIKETFEQTCQNNAMFKEKKILEVNEAGNLTRYLQMLPHHTLIQYPEYDLENLSFPNGQFDIVLHSDTLEHVNNSIRALSECRRMLRPRGFLAYTIPIIPDRSTIVRDKTKPSFHGNPETNKEDYLVYREYGADFWKELFEAGFDIIKLYTIIFPASMAIVAQKN